MRYPILAILGLLALGIASDDVYALSAQPTDTVQPAGVSGGEPLIPNSAYLSRLIARVDRGEPVEVKIEIEIVPPPAALAQRYASRYRISRALAQQIVDVARAEGLDPELAFRMIRVESVFKVRARGPAGALGLTQLMPSTARALDRSVRTEAQILDPTTNLRLGLGYLRKMIERYDGDVRLGLLAYNRGPNAVDRALRAGRDPENGYSHKVLGTRGKAPYAGLGVLSRSR